MTYIRTRTQMLIMTLILAVCLKKARQLVTEYVLEAVQTMTELLVSRKLISHNQTNLNQLKHEDVSY